MNPASRSRPARPSTAHAVGVPAAGVPDKLPSLARILEHYRRHGTLAGSLARGGWPDDSPPAARPQPRSQLFSEPITGLQTRELDGPGLFERYFGSAPPR